MASSDYLVGQLAKSWELTDPSTLVFHLRQGIHLAEYCAGKRREFTADDVVFHYNRMYALAVVYQGRSIHDHRCFLEATGID